jgi:hypothetical protein
LQYFASYSCGFQFLRECADHLLRFRLQVIDLAIERHRQPKTLLRFVLAYDGHKRAIFDSVTIVGRKSPVSL